jgi:NTE family protein
MLLFQPARKRRKSKARVGLAIAGGGPIGGMYELGALRALDVAIDGLDLTRLEVYVGVSSGAFLAASLANRMTTAEICRIFIADGEDDARFRPEVFLRPAVFEYLRRAAGFPRLMLDWWGGLLARPSESSLSEVVRHFGSLLPTGLFDNAGLETFLRDAYTRRGRTNDFRELKAKLFVLSVDLDTGQAVRFGDTGWDDVPISKAVQASSALPGLYPPVEIRGHHFVDGALRRTMHASVALERGVDLLLGINPLVPFDVRRREGGATGRLDKLSEGGLPVVLSQTFRTLLQSRVEIGLAKYAEMYPAADQLVLEPNPDDAEMFFTSIFGFSSRHRVCEHAFRTTIADLAARRDELAPMLAQHDLRFREDILDAPQPSILDGLDAIPRTTETTARLRRALDDVDALVRGRRGKR